MAIGAQARRCRDGLFPNRQSTLKGTDPELVEVFGNGAFDATAPMLSEAF